MKQILLYDEPTRQAATHAIHSAIVSLSWIEDRLIDRSLTDGDLDNILAEIESQVKELRQCLGMK